MSEGKIQCAECGSENIRMNMAVKQTTDDGYKIGLTVERKLRRPKIIPLSAHICTDCGTVARLFTQESNLEDLRS